MSSSVFGFLLPRAFLLLLPQFFPTSLFVNASSYRSSGSGCSVPGAQENPRVPSHSPGSFPPRVPSHSPGSFPPRVPSHPWFQPDWELEQQRNDASRQRRLSRYTNDAFRDYHSIPFHLKPTEVDGTDYLLYKQWKTDSTSKSSLHSSSTSTSTANRSKTYCRKTLFLKTIQCMTDEYNARRTPALQAMDERASATKFREMGDTFSAGGRAALLGMVGDRGAGGGPSSGGAASSSPGDGERGRGMERGRAVGGTASTRTAPNAPAPPRARATSTATTRVEEQERSLFQQSVAGVQEETVGGNQEERNRRP